MPTKTKQINSSPLTIAPMIAASLIKGGVAGVGNILQERKAAKAAGEDYSFGDGLGDFFQGTATGITGIDFRDQAPASVVREDPSQTPTPGAATSTSGVQDISPTGNPAAVPNIDPAQSQLGGLFAPTPIKMSEPRTKKISPVEMSYHPLKMSAKNAAQAGLMMNVSGASSLSPVTNGDEENEGEPKNRKVIEDRGRGLGGITKDTITNKFYSQTFPDVEMDSTHHRNPFDRSIIDVEWSPKKEED